jgi:hypothetical protein
MTDDPFTAELARIEKSSKVKLDDNSLEFLARLRANELLQDDEWERLKGFLRDALQCLRSDDESEPEDEDESVFCPDADPRNADWIRIVRANRLAGYKMPAWAALWRLRTDSSAAFWKKVGKIAKQMGFERMEERTDR